MSGRDTDVVYSASSSCSGLITFYCFTHKSVISHIQHSGHCNKRTPAEVIHHQCNITLLSLSLLFLLYLHHHSGLMLALSLFIFAFPTFPLSFFPSQCSLTFSVSTFKGLCAESSTRLEKATSQPGTRL